MFPLLSVADVVSDIYNNRAKIMAFALAFFIALCLRLDQKIHNLEVVISSRPATSERVVTRTVQGPTRVEYRTVEKPDGEKVTERIVSVASKEVDRDYNHEERPACPLAAPPHRFFAGARLDPRAGEPLLSLAPRVGINIGDRLDLAYSHPVSLDMKSGHQVDLAWRF